MANGSSYGDKSSIDTITDLEGEVNEQYAELGGTLEDGQMIQPEHMGNAHHAVRNIQRVLGANPEGDEGSIQARLDKALTPAGNVKKVGTKEVNETNVGDDKVLVYKSASDKLEYEDKTLGVAVDSIEGATGDIVFTEGPGIASIAQTGPSEVTIEAEVTQADLDVVDAKTGTVGTKEVDEANIATDKILVYKASSGKLEYQSKPDPGVTDHGGLTGPGDDDHPQYHNNARGDARYHTKGVLASQAPGEGAALVGVEDAASHFVQTRVEGVLTELYDEIQDKAGVQTLQGGKGSLTLVAGAGIDSIPRQDANIIINAEVTQSELDAHAADADVHHSDAHTIGSHDTNATGAELNTLTNGPTSDADSLHTHPLLAARDMQHFQVHIAGALSEGRQITHKLIIPFDCDGIGADAIRLWCGTQGAAPMTITLHHYRPLGDSSIGGVNIGTVTMNASTWQATGDCAFAFNAGDGLVFEIAGTNLPADLTISLVVRQR